MGKTNAMLQQRDCFQAFFSFSDLTARNGKKDKEYTPPPEAGEYIVLELRA